MSIPSSPSSEERPAGAGEAEQGPESNGLTNEAEHGTRPRRRRGRRPTAAERRESAAQEAEQAGEPVATEDDNSVVDVEPDLLDAQQVESIGVSSVDTVPSAREEEPAPVERQNQEVRPAPPVAHRAPATGVGGGQARPRPSGYGQGTAPSRPPQGGQRQGQQRAPRPQTLPPGVPSAAALDEIEPARAPAARAEPQGDLGILLRGFEEIQQRNTDRILAALRQTGGNDGAATRTQNATERVGVFVDVPNLVYAARYLNRWIDFGRLLDRLLSGRRLIRAHAYSPTDPDPSADQQFLTPVKSQGYRLTTKNYRTFASGAKKADMDLDLCMDVVRLVVAKAVECVVLCSGDGDFLPLLDFCADNGVRVEVASFVEATSDELRQACDRFYNLSAMEGIRLSRPLGPAS